VAKVSRPVLYGGVALLGIVAWIATAPSESGGGGGQTLRKRGESGRQVQVQFTQEDRDAFAKPFPRLNESPRNAFNPLVAQIDGVGGALAPNEFPANYTGGEAGWFYTGTVVVNDVPSALVENELSGQGLYLKVGERLKNTVIAQITPTYIVVQAPGGQSLRLDLLRDIEEEDGGLGELDVQPVRPDVPGSLSGPIRADGFEIE
jgi:hypothetical protein